MNTGDYIKTRGNHETGCFSCGILSINAASWLQSESAHYIASYPRGSRSIRHSCAHTHHSNTSFNGYTARYTNGTNSSCASEFTDTNDFTSSPPHGCFYEGNLFQ